MPLAFPMSITTTSNYSEPAVAVTFAMARPSEDVADFQTRIVDVGPWGQSGVGRSKVELVLTREAATELVRLLTIGSVLVSEESPDPWSSALGS